MSQLIDDAAFLASVAVAGSVLLTGAAWGTRKAVKLSHRMGDFLDDFMGKPERPGVPAVPGVMVRLQTFAEVQAQLVSDRALVRDQLVADRTEVRTQLVTATSAVAVQMRDFDERLTAIQDQVQVIHHEMVPNEGQSIKDQINRVDAALTADDGDSVKDQINRIDEHTKPS